MTNTQHVIKLTDQYGARNYLPLPIVISEADGVWVKDPEGNEYMDMLSAYSALNQGHRHRRIVNALKQQADKVTITSRAFHNDQLCLLYEEISEITGKQRVLPMNTGAEAVETAIKAVRRWAYQVKGVADDKAEIIVCEGNFHGRTTAVISFSSEDAYKAGYGPLMPGFKIIPYGDIEALADAINENTAAFLVEPIQGEAGIRIPADGFMAKAYELCKENNVLFCADEIQTGLGRTGKMFCCEWDDVDPDVYIMGKALGGGVYPVSAIAADEEIMQVFDPGSHGSTFGGNPLAAAVGVEALRVIKDENLVARSLEMGDKFTSMLGELTDPNIKEIRGKGLLIGVELHVSARSYCEQLMAKGVLAKETHDNVIRFAPPLIITDDELDWAMERIRQVLS